MIDIWCNRCGTFKELRKETINPQYNEILCIRCNSILSFYNAKEQKIMVLRANSKDENTNLFMELDTLKKVITDSVNAIYIENSNPINILMRANWCCFCINKKKTRI